MYRPAKETGTCPIGFLGQFYIRKVACPQSADGVLIMKNAFIDHTQIVKIKIHNWTAPRIFHYISFALHFICITLHLHLKIVPRQHEMHDTSRFKCHALHLHFMK